MTALPIVVFAPMKQPLPITASSLITTPGEIETFIPILALLEMAVFDDAKPETDASG